MYVMFIFIYVNAYIILLYNVVVFVVVCFYSKKKLKCRFDRSNSYKYVLSYIKYNFVCVHIGYCEKEKWKRKRDNKKKKEKRKKKDYNKKKKKKLEKNKHFDKEKIMKKKIIMRKRKLYFKLYFFILILIISRAG
ncbi:hypothetical protein RFI_24843 [Reticulomyxa filosa]|uniref:Uncharacterized protein n=1 Tax=Reticulomyxa filosa TaxID=46433 RepID=X6MGJ1_RETFI|nr:hypothetical protein RFI_24843 [Reticulomyxa filosa]|eukprot:ETO12532.1 hypothetical protein RFI_24843 [Reticulomyxa filosa]